MNRNFLEQIEKDENKEQSNPNISHSDSEKVKRPRFFFLCCFSRFGTHSNCLQKDESATAANPNDETESSLLLDDVNAASISIHVDERTLNLSSEQVEVATQPNRKEIKDDDHKTRFKQIFRNATFFLIKSINYENVDLAKSKVNFYHLHLTINHSSESLEYFQI